MSEQEKKRRPQYVSMTESGPLASNIKTTVEAYMEEKQENTKEQKQDGTNETV